MTDRAYTCAKPGCGIVFTAKVADRKRGWATHCSKSCAAWTREKKLDRNDYAGDRQKDTGGGFVFFNGNFSNEEYDCNKE